jgi:hypothetical protein
MKTSKLAAALALSLAAVTAQAGEIITINPDGAGIDPAIRVGSLGWNNGNAIAVAENGESLGPGDIFVGQQLQTYGHGALANFIDSQGNTIGGLNLNGQIPATNYEWTYVFGVQEEVLSVQNPGDIVGTVAFQPIAGGTNFFEIWYDSNINPNNSNNLSGLGFNNGTLILSGTILPVGISSFTNAPELPSALDGFGPNNYPGVTSVRGAGSSNLTIEVNSADSNFFAPGSSLISLNFNTFQNLPYSEQNPSACFWTGSTYIGGAGTCSNNGASATIGAINGVTGPNVMFQTRATNDFITAVPEPATIGLFGAGLLALGTMGRRRKEQSLKA